MVSCQPMSDCQWTCVGPVFAVCSAPVELDRSLLAAFQPIKYVVSPSETLCNKSHWLVVLYELYDMWIFYICEQHGCLEWKKWRRTDQHDFLKTVSNGIYRLLPPAGMEGYLLSYKHRMYMLVWPLAVVFAGCSSSSFQRKRKDKQLIELKFIAKILNYLLIIFALYYCNVCSNHNLKTHLNQVYHIVLSLSKQLKVIY